MRFFYFLGLVCYDGFLSIVALFHPKARLLVKGRRTTWKKLASLPSTTTAWFHCASLGEFEQGRPVMEAYKSAYPTHQIVLSFYSPSGYEIRKDYQGADVVVYLPSDRPGKVNRFLSLVKPDIAFFVKYEFWPNYFRAMKSGGIPLIHFAGIFRAEQRFFKGSSYWQEVLSSVSHFFVQQEASASLLQRIGLKNVSITGDTRFDRVAQVASNPKQFPDIEAWAEGHKVVVLGSAWPEDLRIMTLFLEQVHNTKIIIAPHEITGSHFDELISLLPEKPLRYSQQQGTIPEKSIMIIDSIGMLSSLYNLADVVYVGGSFGKGLHNTLEAAVFGKPIIVGPEFSKFQEVIDLVDRKGVVSISSAKELSAAMLHLLNDATARQRQGDICRSYVKEKLGATDLIMKHITEHYS